MKHAQENACYMLGTDFKAGQTKFKTAAVEYIRSLGMCPKVSPLSDVLAVPSTLLEVIIGCLATRGITSRYYETFSR